MKTAKHAGLALVTAPDATVARRLAKAALEARLVACANLVPKVESHYWWQGKLEKGTEVLIIFKTTRARLKALEKLVLANHPYDTAEFIFVPVGSATEKYLRWWEDSVR